MNQAYKNILLSFLVIFFSLWNILGQENLIIENLEKIYRSGDLTSDSTLLLINETDPYPLIAAKQYYQAVLEGDLDKSLILHELNFQMMEKEFYGQLSGIQLIAIDFIKKDYEQALRKINKINADQLPEVLYWKAKILQTAQRYDEVITICQTHLTKYPQNHTQENMFVILLECFFYKKDLRAFEKNYDQFSHHSDFQGIQPYLLYLNALLYEELNTARARSIYQQIIATFPTSQYRVQAEDRIYSLRNAGQRNTIVAPQPIDIDKVSRYEDLPSTLYYIQFGVFAEESTAQKYVNSLAKDNIKAFYVSKPIEGKRLYAVVQGSFTTLRQAQGEEKKINQQKYKTFIFKVE